MKPTRNNTRWRLGADAGVGEDHAWCRSFRTTDGWRTVHVFLRHNVYGKGETGETIVNVYGSDLGKGGQRTHKLYINPKDEISYVSDNTGTKVSRQDIRLFWRIVRDIRDRLVPIARLREL